MDASNVTGLQAQASSDPSALLAAVGGIQEAGGGFGPLLGQLLSRGPEATAGGPLLSIEISTRDLLTREFAGLMRGEATEESSATSFERLGDGKGHDGDVLSRALSEALGFLMALFSGKGDTQPDEALAKDGERNDEAPEVAAALTLGPSGTAPTVSPSEAPSPIEINGAAGGAFDGLPGRVKKSDSATTADERKGSTLILSGPDAGKALGKEAPVLAPAVPLNAEEAKVAGSASSFRNIISDSKAVRSGGAADVHRPLDAKGRANDLSAFGGAKGETTDGESNLVGSRTSERISASSDTTDVDPYRSESVGTYAGAASAGGTSGMGARQNSADMMPPHAGPRDDSAAPTAPKHVPETVRTSEVPGDRFLVLRHDEGSVEVSVKVEHLGKLRIELVMDDGVVNARIQTSDAAAKSVIENNLGQLLENLTREGVSIGNVAVSLREKREPSEGDQNPRTKPNTAEVVNVALDAPSVAQGLISIYA